MTNLFNTPTETCQALIQILEKLDAPELLTVARLLSQRFANPQAFVTLVGETSTGKTTIVNGLLSERLPQRLITRLANAGILPLRRKRRVHRRRDIDAELGRVLMQCLDVGHRLADARSVHAGELDRAGTRLPDDAPELRVCPLERIHERGNVGGPVRPAPLRCPSLYLNTDLSLGPGSIWACVTNG